MNGSFTPDTLSALRVRADALMEIGRYREAIPILQDALGISPDEARLHCRMANVLLKIGDRKRALQAAERAIAADPNEEWGHRIHCIILLKGRDKRKTLLAAQEAVSLAPHKVQPLYVLTRALLNLRKTGEARQTAMQLRQIAPASPWAHEAMTLVAIQSHQWIEAEIHCRSLLQINPHSFSAFNNLGVALRAMKRQPEAAAAFLEAMRLNPIESLPRRNLESTLDDYYTYFLLWPLAGAGLMIFLGCLPLGEHATYGPQWAHIMLVGGGLLLMILTLFLWYRRFHSLPPTVHSYIQRQLFWRKFIRR